MTSDSNTAIGFSWKGRLVLNVLRLALLLAAAAVLLELSVRVLITYELPGLRRFAIRVRQPNNFAARTDPEYWKLKVMFRRPEKLKPIPNYDPQLGWSGRIEAGTYAHPREAWLGDRRPILFYGDSFTACTGTREKDCWEGLVATSELGDEYGLLNYGVGGYGVGQIYRMMTLTVDRFLDRDPVVIIGIMVDDDLSRSVLPLRGWPKPRFRVEDGRLVDDGPVIEGLQPYLDANPPRIWSYAWRFLKHGTSILPQSWREDREGEEERLEEIAEVNRAILLEIQNELESRDVEWFFLLFYGQGMMSRPGRLSWEHRFMVETLEEMDAPYVATLRPMIADRFREKRAPEDYFVQDGITRGHYNELGNRAAFGAIVDGVAGRFFESRPGTDLSRPGATYR
ncbi:MAG: hypothetical protein O7B99_09475 [Planctomycetota bacterium]|nr:hypothetical protein [Planctomycetota bacterium]